MPKSIISYDKDLPEIPGRRPWERPTSFLVKDSTATSGWRVDDSGRQPSKLLLTQKLRTVVDHWRKDSYTGASDVTQRLFAYWFEEDHEVAGFPVPFRYHFCQREAIETLVYLVEVAQIRDAKALVDAYAEVFRRDLLSQSIAYQTTMDGQRQLRRYVPELDAEGVQDLPPENLRRYAFKMATGSGKTWVMAMAMVWSHFHKRRIPGSDLSTNFLIVAPNIIVYQRLEKDFASNRIFHELPLIPPEWRGTWSQKVILRGESTEPDASGNLFLTNFHQLYETREQVWTPQNAIEALLGRKPVKDLATAQRSMLERLKELQDLVVFNDEAHHIHDVELRWTQSLLGIHRALPHGLALWLDFSATPKDQHGMYFPWTVCDSPLARRSRTVLSRRPSLSPEKTTPTSQRKTLITSPERTSARSTATGSRLLCSAGRNTTRPIENSAPGRSSSSWRKRTSSPMPLGLTSGRPRSLVSKKPKCSLSTPMPRVRSRKKTWRRPVRWHAISTSQGTESKPSSVS